MSRTVRRVGKSLDLTREAHWIEKDNWEFITSAGRPWGRLYYPREFLTGKEYKKGWWTFHSDHHRWRRHRNNLHSWSTVRMINKEDLCKWFKNDEHELFFAEDVNKRDWD